MPRTARDVAIHASVIMQMQDAVITVASRHSPILRRSLAALRGARCPSCAPEGLLVFIVC
jgi:hypothetical protein